ncbi:hypothetical protein COY26_03250 [Candidatus Woesearchaeota archaeon CG_4_10_14_0_2_um_filter_33_10]|nr:MAG: hypothetical protein AUJ83_02745 [Candidatus Woesearchaeota archaeon CG1_02_33_12]PIN77824.1 MAG: hypothetical protein COV14_05015 [Candidatus Woesearchaeota archaeon CG10_big_fil_rev_8_21_14_0_10_33_12]PIU72972.1 MAG: hypothetical protein COS79_00440 [Candidatus Woesearchaeota archaeon CG06_land_8_20_14_3_00_33_13]PIZ52916.1 MAG: hypothetical protein COY26_03250 [Candidatus Woesearchaeota archaeon CG_4_10_14_0_2_um_filter_33_10]
MSGPAKSKIEIKNVKVYIHKKDPLTNSRIMHIDIESDELNKIIKDKEATYCAGKPGGVFIGLKKEMLERAKKLVEEKEKS